MAALDRLADEFNADMWQILEKEHEFGWCSTRFREMLETQRGVNVAHQLLKTNPTRPMFKEARRLRRPDLVVEHYVCSPKYRDMFSEEERKAAKFRLDYGD